MTTNRKFNSIKRGLLEALKEPIKKIMEKEQEYQRTLSEIDLCDMKIKAFGEASSLLDGFGFQIESITTPITHKAIQAINDGFMFGIEEFTKEQKNAYVDVLQQGKIFLLSKKLPEIGDHDSFSGRCEILLPFPITIFELKVFGSRLICVATQTNGEMPNYQLGLFSNNSYVPMALRQCLLTTEIQKQIESVCILLDAGVAEKSVIRVPTSLNKKREKNGKEKIKDHYLIDLSKRNKYSSTGELRGPGVRLHFRRGHWRHYESHKTWIKWMLVGDRELGFVEKGYRL